MILRDYQQAAHDAAIGWMKKCIEPSLIVAATGAGKSLIVAAIANTIQKMSGKKILCIAPSKELVEQNHGKYLATGNPASIYSAAIRKELKHPVVFGSPQTVMNSLRKFGDGYAAVIVDEAHGITPTMRRILDHMRTQNPKLRILGLTATPYRMGTGYIYGHHFERGPVDEGQTKVPYFHTCIYEIGARFLIERGYLTPIVTDAPEQHYDTSGLKLNASGKFDAATVEQAFVGKGRLTAEIVADVVAKSRDRHSVLLFCATVQHAQEALESLPPGLSAIVHGETPRAERERILAQFKSGQLKYLVNVAVLTTGFDAPSVDVVAMLRRTESPGLLQQIIGRGMRLHDGKANCLLLDYAENIENHFPHGDIFAPEIKVGIGSSSERVQIVCPVCDGVNMFPLRPKKETEHAFGYDPFGYLIDMMGARITNQYGEPESAHLGRRCTHEHLQRDGTMQRCQHRWTGKVCGACDTENDIAARYCSACKEELVDPNEKLKRAAAMLANDPYRLRSASVISRTMSRHQGRKGPCLRVEYEIDEKPYKISEYVTIESESAWARKNAHLWCVRAFGRMFETVDAALAVSEQARTATHVEYRKQPNNPKYYTVEAVKYE